MEAINAFVIYLVINKMHYYLFNWEMLNLYNVKNLLLEWLDSSRQMRSENENIDYCYRS